MLPAVDQSWSWRLPRPPHCRWYRYGGNWSRGGPRTAALVRIPDKPYSAEDDSSSRQLLPVRPRLVFERTSTTTIMSTRYPPLRAIVPGYLYEGFTVLAGRQKLGKTWLGIDWALAVATGGIAMGSI